MQMCLIYARYVIRFYMIHSGSYLPSLRRVSGQLPSAWYMLVAMLHPHQRYLYGQLVAIYCSLVLKLSWYWLS